MPPALFSGTIVRFYGKNQKRGMENGTAAMARAGNGFGVTAFHYGTMSITVPPASSLVNTRQGSTLEDFRPGVPDDMR
jgi:hypothetical protein